LTASLIPCMALLFHEAIRDLRRRHGRHGTVQMLVLVLRAAVHVLALSMLGTGTGASSQVSIWCEQGITALWLIVEGRVLWDVFFSRRGVCCAHKVSSQVLWSVAVAGHVLFASLTLTPCSSATRSSSNLRGSQKSSANSLFHLWPTLIESVAVSSPPEIHSHTSQPSLAGNALQEVALSLCLAAYLSIHAPVFASWASRVRQATLHALACMEPDRVVFYDCKHRSD